MPAYTPPRPRPATSDSQRWVDDALRSVLGDDLGSLRHAGLPERLGTPEATALRRTVADRFRPEQIGDGRTVLRWVAPVDPVGGDRGPARAEPVSEFLARRANLLCPDALAALDRVEIIGSVECVTFAGDLERFEGLRRTARIRIAALREEFVGAADKERVDQLFDDLLSEQGAVPELRLIALPDRTLSGERAQRVRVALHTLAFDLRCLREGWEAQGEDELVVGLHRLHVSIHSFRVSIDRCYEACDAAGLVPRDLDVLPAPGMSDDQAIDSNDPCDDPGPAVTIGRYLQRCRHETELWSAVVGASGAGGARYILESVRALRSTTKTISEAMVDIGNRSGSSGRKTHRSVAPFDHAYAVLLPWVTRFRLEVEETHRAICMVIKVQDGGVVASPPAEAAAE